MTAVYNIYLFDDCCHQFISQDTGATFIEAGTPNQAQDIWGDPGVGTLLDGWPDAQMAINDGDYLHIVAFDDTYGIGIPSAITTFGILGGSKTGGTANSWVLVDPEKSSTGIPPSPAFMPQSDGSFGVDWQRSFSGAITANAQTVLVCINESSASTTPFYPRISRDKGLTWSDVTTLPASQPWARAAFSAGGTIMYLKPDNSKALPDKNIYKSTDSGATWAQLSGGPVYHNVTCDEFEIRMRCSADGQVIVTMAKDGNFWISKDGGANWTNTNMKTFFGGFSGTGSLAGDCGITPDGKTIIVGMDKYIPAAFGYWPCVAVSTDGGASFTDVTANIQYPASAGPPVFGAPTTNPTRFTQCNVAPDGLGMIITFAYSDNPRFGPDGLLIKTTYVNVSVSSGTAFTLRSIAANELQSGSPVGVFTAIYITPFTPLPGPVPPFVPPKGGYIIERFDNRVWPTVENAWCVDCAFTLARPTPNADLNASSSTGAGIPIGVTDLVGGKNYSASTTAQVIDGNGLGPGTGAIATLTLSSGVIVAVTISGGSGYVFPNLVLNDPENLGSGASATVTLDNTVQFFASAPVFSFGDVGSVIRAGYGVAKITTVTDSQNVVANMLSPIVRIQPDDPIDITSVETQLSGTWTMTKPISQFYLPTLAGFEITGLADGQVIPPVVVPSNGIVTLADPASAIIVGLAFQAQLQSTYLDAGEPTVQGQRKKIAEVTVRVEQSAAFQIGANQPDGSVQSPQQLAPLWQNMVDAPTHAVAPFGSTALPLFTGDIRVPIPGGYNTRGQVAVQQFNPLPLQVLDYSNEILAGDKPSQEAPQRQRGKGGGQGQQ